MCENRSAMGWAVTMHPRQCGMCMQAIICLIVAILSCGTSSNWAATPVPMTFDGARWIWSVPAAPRGPNRQAIPGGVCFFRASLTVPEQSLVKSATLAITADNLFTLYINGKLAGEGHADPNAWSRPRRFDVAGVLLPGQNVIAVEAINTVPGPAGLLVKLSGQLNDGQSIELGSDTTWKATDKEEANWTQLSFDDNGWRPASVVADYGQRPWGKIAARDNIELAGVAPDAARKAVQQTIAQLRAKARSAPSVAAGIAVNERTAGTDYAWPGGVIYLGDDCTQYRPLQHSATARDSLGVTVFTTRKSRAYPEHDLPSPLKIGRKLFVLSPAKPGVEPKLLFDAGQGAIGTPRVTFDGEWLLLALARPGDPFFHIYRMPINGGTPRQLTNGPFHDIDPTELPDGRIAFTSTRIGMFDEYHSPPARALHVMNADGTDIRPLTQTFIFDNEPQVLADGRILFIRSDNFFDRGKVETLLHAMHPDGTRGYTEFGLDNGPEYGSRLRAFYCGSPAPLPDGRVAFVSAPGITVGHLGSAATAWRNLSLEAGDVAAMPDGRLICTLGKSKPVEIGAGKQKRQANDIVYDRLAVIELGQDKCEYVVLHDAAGAAIHSPVFVGPRERPPVLATSYEEPAEPTAKPTGYFFCQNARATRNTTAGWSHVRAIRVLAGKGLTVRSSHSYIVHAGSEVLELGTVPLAPDGSFYVEVPADMAIAFQAVDAEGRSELNEMSWIYVRPGERRGCVGCHHSRQGAPSPAAMMPLAAQVPPLRLLNQGRPHRFRGNNAAVTGLMELQFDRYREVASLNRHSETRDPLATGCQEVTDLVAELRGSDTGRQISAANRLALARDPNAAPALVQALGSANREVRVAAAVALATCGSRASIAPLFESLDDRDPLVRQAAAMAIENLTGLASDFDAFGSFDDRRARISSWRGEFDRKGWDSLERDLIGRLAEGDRDAQRRAAVALGHTGAAAAAAALRAYVASAKQTNPHPEWRKSHRGDGARFNSLADVNPRTLQAATRALGYLHDADAVPLLDGILRRSDDPEQSNLFLAEAAAEALGRIPAPASETALLAAAARLKDYFYYVGWYGDHPALFACHASPVHHLITEALDARGVAAARPIVPNLIRSLPTDVDRALFCFNDDCEALVGRVIRRAGAEGEVVETCLALLGDPAGRRVADIEQAIGVTYQAWGGKPDIENRAAHVLSAVCRRADYEPRVRAAFERYRARAADDIPRVFDTGIPVVQRLPVKAWVMFFLARTLGNLRDPRSAPALIAALETSPAESAGGHPDPCGPGVLFLQNELTPYWRAAAAWALGQIGDRRAAPALVRVVGNLQNAVDTRHTAAEALGVLADPATAPAVRKLAADYPEFSTRRALRHALELMEGAAAPPAAKSSKVVQAN